MSPGPKRPETRPESFPRVSGDEPALQIAALARQMFSPRERG